MPLLIFHTLQYSFIPDAGGRLEARRRGILTDSFMRCFLQRLRTSLMSLPQGPDRPICTQFPLEVLNSYPMRCSVYARFASSRLCDFSSGQWLR